MVGTSISHHTTLKIHKYSSIISPIHQSIDYGFQPPICHNLSLYKNYIYISKVYDYY